MCGFRLKKIAIFAYQSVKYIGPDLTNDKFNDTHLHFESCDSTHSLSLHQQNSLSSQDATPWNLLFHDLKVCESVINFILKFLNYITTACPFLTH